MFVSDVNASEEKWPERFLHREREKKMVYLEAFSAYKIALCYFSMNSYPVEHLGGEFMG
jgi:hypothetical protein